MNVNLAFSFPFSLTIVQVICKVQENISRLSVEQFYELYQAFLIWPTWVRMYFLVEHMYTHVCIHMYVYIVRFIMMTV